ncbi:hypothetical protein MITS9509_00454 [Synechococcus sp. MIT S9509]|uniref:hypothetical protein n=1 Tax=Synechococcus sp. MIT S9509 TaxID=1801630 RepID=UPI0007BB93F7|nr:hypothetical protein [Synechococcus sp. MIT S9509]KZR93161.1 hypothetical protein MITS9509_00454 [Synechococcus sp. MIT S9509]
MNKLDLEVVNVLFFQQMLDAVEQERWDEAAMTLYKLYAIEEGERFDDLQDNSVELNNALKSTAA